MWEAIRANRRRSTVLIWMMGVLLVGLGFAIGLFYDPEMGGAVGAVIALFFWLIMLAVAFGQGKGILLLSTGARKIEKKDYPMLYNVVEEMTIASGLGKVPDIYVIEDDSLNAFAMGIKTDNAAVAFKGANYIIIAISTGGLKAMAYDLSIPEEYGIYHTVGDTSGPAEPMSK